MMLHRLILADQAQEDLVDLISGFTLPVIPYKLRLKAGSRGWP